MLFGTKENLGKTKLVESIKVVTNLEWIPFFMYFKEFLGQPIGHQYLHVACSNNNHCTYLQVWDLLATLQLMMNFAHICNLSLYSFDIS